MSIITNGLILISSALLNILPADPTSTAGLWFNRSGSQVEANDFTFLANMYQERTSCTRWGRASTNFTGTLPTDVNLKSYGVFKPFDLTNSTSTTPYKYYYNSTNAIFYKDYSVTDKTDIPYTNKWISGNTDWYQQHPKTLDNSFIDPFADNQVFFYNYDYSNRWILGVYDSFAVSGIPEPAYNGTYKRTISTVYHNSYPYTTFVTNNYEFVNNNGIIMTYTKDGTVFQGGDNWFDYEFSSTLPPWFDILYYDTSFFGETYPPFHITVAKGAFLPDIGIDDAPCQTFDFTTDWIILNKAPSYDNFFAQMDMGIFGYPYTTTYTTNNIPTTAFLSSENSSPMVGGGINYPQKDIFYLHQGQDIYWSQNYGMYIKPEYFGVDSQPKWGDWALQPETWGLTNMYQETNSGAWIVNFDSNVSVPSNSPHTRIRKNDFQQRYDVMKKMEVLVLKRRGGVPGDALRENPFWERYPSETNNYWAGSGSSTNSFQDAFNVAISNSYRTGRAQTAPYMNCQKQQYGSTPPIVYVYSFAIMDGKLSTYATTNNTHNANAYVRAQQQQHEFHDGTGLGLLQNQYKKINSPTWIPDQAKYESYVQSYPYIPLTNGGAYVYINGGFTIDDSLYQLKLDMKYK